MDRHPELRRLDEALLEAVIADQEMDLVALPDPRIEKRRRLKRFKRFMWRSVRPLILKTLACIAGINIVLCMLMIDNLTTDGMILAAIVNIPGLIYLSLFLYVNGWILDTDPWEDKEERCHGHDR